MAKRRENTLGNKVIRCYTFLLTIHIEHRIDLFLEEELQQIIDYGVALSLSEGNIKATKELQRLYPSLKTEIDRITEDREAPYKPFSLGELGK